MSGPMVTVGVDLAGYSGTTGLCRVTWGPRPVVEILPARDDDDLLAAMRTADKTGLDAPVGWPVAFTALLVAHQAGAALPAAARYASHSSGRDGLSRFTHRLTDDLAWKRGGAGGRRPLSVSADKLGVVAMRAVALLERLADGGPAVPRDGSGPVAEVYPAVALRQWGLAPGGSYKGAKPTAAAARTEVVDGIARASGLDLPDRVRDRCVRSDHDLDALTAALVARAAALDLTDVPADDHEREMAAVEGWMHVPRGGTSLADLRGDASY